MTEVKTICVNCKYHSGAGKNEGWYSHLCKHPAVQPDSYIDPVTGNVIQHVRNTLSRRFGNT